VVTKTRQFVIRQPMEGGGYVNRVIRERNREVHHGVTMGSPEAPKKKRKVTTSVTSFSLQDPPTQQTEEQQQ